MPTSLVQISGHFSPCNCYWHHYTSNKVKFSAEKSSIHLSLGILIDNYVYPLACIDYHVVFPATQ